MNEQFGGDRYLKGQYEAHRPFEGEHVGFDLSKSIVVLGQSFGGLASLLLGRAGRSECVVDLRDHNRHR